MSHCYIRLQCIKALSFDLDDTLYDNSTIITKAQGELDKFLGKRFPATKKWTAKDWLALKRTLVSSNPNLGHDTTQARIETLTQGLTLLGYRDREINIGVNEAMACFSYHRSNFSITPDILKLLTSWARILPLVGITNGNVNANNIGLKSIFKFVLQAGKGVKMKPEADMFTLASEALALPKHQMLHIGDNWQADVQGARLAGLQSAWLNPAFGKQQASSIGKGLLPHIEIEHLAQLTPLVNAIASNKKL